MKKLLFALLFATRVTHLVSWFNRNKVKILCYHSVTKRPQPSPDDIHKLHLPIDLFRDQIDYLETHYRIFSLSEFVSARQANLKLPPNAAILTFDDGFRNFLTIVAPLLLERRIPATSFIVTGENFTRDNGPSDGIWKPEDDENYLTWSDIRRLADLGLEFGSHSSTHVRLTDVPAADAHRELEDSLQAVKTNLQRSNIPFSYPHGKTSESISRLAQAVGYSCALTSELGQNDADCDMFALRRIVIASDDDLPTFAARISGFTFWRSRLTELVAKRNVARQKSAASYEPMSPEECTENKSF